jgi:hypothetical protein
MWSEKYLEPGATISCTMRATNKTANFGQKEDEHHQFSIIGKSCFISMKTADAMCESGQEWIGVIKASHCLFLKEELENMLKTWPGGMILTMEATASKGVTLIAAGYKYNFSNAMQV